MDLVAEFGYSSLTLSNIAASADVTLSSVRNLSPNTGDLLAEAMEQSLLAWRETTPNSKPWEDAASREERVRCRLQVAADRARDSLPIWWRVGMIVSLLDKSDEVPAQRVFARVHKESELELRDLLHKLAPDAVAEQPMLLNTLAGMFMAIIDGMWLGRRAAPDADYSFLVALLAPALLRVVDNWAAQAPLVMEQLTTAEPDTAARRLARPASSADSRARLIEAAARLAAERGFRGATIEAICQRAGTPVGSLYWHFQDKSDLFDRVIQESIAAGAAEHPVVGTGESWEQAVQAWLVRTSLWMQPQRAP